MKSRVIHIQDHRPEAALEALNRLTGLTWSSYPQSLLDRVTQPQLREATHAHEEISSVQPRSSCAK